MGGGKGVFYIFSVAVAAASVVDLVISFTTSRDFALRMNKPYLVSVASFCRRRITGRKGEKRAGSYHQTFIFLFCITHALSGLV